MRPRLFLPKFPKSAGTIKEFRDWDIKNKNEYPMLYKISSIIETVYWKLIRYPSIRLKDAYYWIQYRVNPKYKYTTIKLERLTPGYYDPDTLILYSMFEIFEKFMKKQLTDPHVVWEYSESNYAEWELKEQADEVKQEIERRNAIWKEMNDLYQWWTVTRPNRDNTVPDYPQLPKEWGMLAALNEDFEDTDEIKEWKQISETRLNAEEQWEEEDEEMLIRLIKIRKSLWD